MTADALARALKARRSGSGWMAHCVAHDDRTPSLGIRVGTDGRILVRCYSGCPQEAVIAALKAMGLWECPKSLTAAERAQWARQQRDVEQHLPDALLWRRAALSIAEDMLTGLKASLFDPAEPAFSRVDEIGNLTSLIDHLSGLTDSSLVAEFLESRRENPKLVRCMVAVMKRRDRAERQALLAYLQTTDPGLEAA